MNNIYEEKIRFSKRRELFFQTPCLWPLGALLPDPQSLDLQGLQAQRIYKNFHPPLYFSAEAHVDELNNSVQMNVKLYLSLATYSILIIKFIFAL